MRALALSSLPHFRSVPISLASADSLSLDALSSSFSDQASNPAMLTSMLLGGQAFHLGRMAGMRLASFLPRTFSVLSEFTSFSCGLALETSIFRTSQNFLSANSHSPVFSSGWVSTALDLGLFKGFASLTVGSHFITRHLAQDAAVVTSRRLCQSLGIEGEILTGDLVRDLVNAEAMSLSMSLGAHIGHIALGGRNAVLERNLVASHSLSLLSRPPAIALPRFSPLRHLALGALGLSGCNGAHASGDALFVTAIFTALGAIGLHAAVKAHRAHRAGLTGSFSQGFFLELLGGGIQEWHSKWSSKYRANPELPGLTGIEGLQKLVFDRFYDSLSNPHQMGWKLTHEKVRTIFEYDDRIHNIPTTELLSVARLPIKMEASPIGEPLWPNDVRWLTRILDISWAWRILHVQTNTYNFEAANQAHNALMALPIPKFFPEVIILGKYQGAVIPMETRRGLFFVLHYLTVNRHPEAQDFYTKVQQEAQDESIRSLIANPPLLTTRSS